MNIVFKLLLHIRSLSIQTQTVVIVLKAPDLVPAAQKPTSVLKRADYRSRLYKAGPSQTSEKNELIRKGNNPVLSSLPFALFQTCT